MGSNYLLLRTNPKLTGNIKLCVSSDDKIFLNSIPISQTLSQSYYQKKQVSPNSNYGNDINKFFNDNKTPSEIIYEVGRTADDAVIHQEYEKQYEKQYEYGFNRNTNRLYNEQFSIFAPIFINSELPSKFIILRMNGALPYHPKIEDGTPLIIGNRYIVYSDSNKTINMGGNIYSNGQPFIATTSYFSGEADLYIDDPKFEYKLLNDKSELNKQLINNSDIVKIIDLSKDGSNIGKYLDNHVHDALYDEKFVNVDFGGNTVSYNGIDINSGTISEKYENLSKFISEDMDILLFDEYVTNGFSRNRMISHKILNIEFLFDDVASEDYKFYRYFGLYVDDIDFAQFELKKENWTISTSYQNVYIDKQVIPLGFNKNVIDDGGIKILPNTLSKKFNGHIDYDLIRQNDMLCYVKDANSTIRKIRNSDCVDGVLCLCDKSIDLNNLFGFADHIEESIAEPINAGKSSNFIQINGSIPNGVKISLRKGNDIISSIYGDSLGDIYPLYVKGSNLGFYFYPTGTVEEIAKAVCLAFNFVTEVPIIISSVDNKIYFECIEKGNNNNDYNLLISGTQTTNVGLYKNYFSGGTDTLKNKIIVKTTSIDNIDDVSYIICNKGYTKVNGISLYLDEPLYDIYGNIKQYKNVDNYRVISINDKSQQIVTTSSGKITLFKLKKITFGVFNIINVGDFDTSTKLSEYSKSYSNEYGKYYHSKKLKIGDVYFILRLKGDVIASSIKHDGTIYTMPGDGISETLLSLSGSGYVVGDTFSINGGVTLATGRVLTIDGFGGVLTYDIYFPGGGYAIATGIGTTSITGIGTGFEIDIVTVDTCVFVSTSEDYEILAGNPIIINQKYRYDDELIKFIGFNSISNAKSSFSSSVDDITNKESLIVPNLSTEYDRLHENSKSILSLKSKIIPCINKWRMGGGKDVRDNPYRLNLSPSFGEFNFSPSHIDESQNSSFFTHEWYYMGGTPELMTYDDLDNCRSYMFKPFNKTLATSDLFDYFKDYFETDFNYINDVDSSRKILTSLLSLSGSGYVVGDTFSINGGVTLATGRVLTIDGFGGVLTYDIYFPGGGYAIATGIGTTSITGIGTGFEIDIVTVEEIPNGYSPGYKVINKLLSRKFSTFEKIGSSYFTFFRGVRIMLDSTTDYSGYRFSAVMNIINTKQFINANPVSIEIIENTNFKSITLLLEVVIDDYKIATDYYGTKVTFTEYLYLYSMNSLRKYNTTLSSLSPYEFGILFDYPSFPSISLYNDDSSPINLTKSFKGYQIFNKFVSSLASDPSKMNMDGYLKNINVGDEIDLTSDQTLGRIIGMDRNGFLTISTLNGTYIPTKMLMRKPSTFNGTNDKQIILSLDDLFIVAVPSLSAGINMSPHNANLIYPLKNISWFIEDGGRNVYKKIGKLSSFSHIYNAINNNNVKITSYVDGIKKDKNDFIIRLLPPNQINTNKYKSSIKELIQFPQLPNTPVFDYHNTEVLTKTTFFRYSGNYVPIINDIIKFAPYKNTLRWSSCADKGWVKLHNTWKELDLEVTLLNFSDGKWSETDGYNFVDIAINNEYVSMPLYKDLMDYNFRFSLGDSGDLSEYFHHKISDNNIINLKETPYFPDVDEICIDSSIKSVMEPSLSPFYFIKNTDKFKTIFVSGENSLIESKSFFNGKQLKVPNKIVIDNIKYVNDNNLDGSTILADDEIHFNLSANALSIAFKHNEILSNIIYSKSFEEFKKYFRYFKIGNPDNLIKEYINKNVSNFEERNITVYLRDNPTNSQQVTILQNTLSRLDIIKQGFKNVNNIGLTSTATQTFISVPLLPLHKYDVIIDIEFKL